MLNNPKKLLVILDPAHGEDTPGKRSPDDRHREYKWSRERLRELDILLLEAGYVVLWTNITDKEIGLTTRKNKGSAFAKQYPELVALFISLHNNAAGSNNEWKTATGIEVFTSPGRTASDIFADIMIKALFEKFPEVKHRWHRDADQERDKEANLTVLMGAYAAMLIEILFQDNEADLALLEDAEFNKRVVDCLFTGIERINEYALTKMNK